MLRLVPEGSSEDNSSKSVTNTTTSITVGAANNNSSKKKNNSSNNNNHKNCLMKMFYCIHNGWCTGTERIRRTLVRSVVAISHYGVQYPRYTIIFISFISLLLLVCGLMTNFDLNLNMEVIFTPMDSPIHEHRQFLMLPFHERIRQSYANPNTHYSDKTWDEIKPTLPKEGSGRRTRHRHRFLKGNEAEEVRPLNDTMNELDVHVDGVSNQEEVTEVEEVGTIEVYAQSWGGVPNPNEFIPKEDEVEEEEEEEIDDNEEEGNKKPKRPERQVDQRIFTLLLHAGGRNVLSREGVLKLFDAIDAVRNLPNYDHECRVNNYIDIYTGEPTCIIWGITRFWNHNRTLFEEEVKTDEDLIEAMSVQFFPDGGYVDIPMLVGGGVKDENDRTVGGKAFFVWFFLTGNPALDKAAINTMKVVSKQWEQDSSDYYEVEFSSMSSYADEIGRAILTDLPLIPMTLVIMCTFTCFVFFKFHAVYSRCLLGIGSVITIIMSICTGYGIMFIAGMFGHFVIDNEKNY